MLTVIIAPNVTTAMELKAKIATLSETLDAANRVMIGSLVCAALAAIVVAISTFLVIRWQSQLDQLKDEAFETYKVEASKVVAQAGTDAADANKKAAEANARAAEAELNLAKLKAPRTISNKNVEAIVARLKSLPAVQFDIAAANDKESLNFALALSGVLTSSSWLQLPFKGGDFSYNIPGLPTIGVVVEKGVSIQAEMPMQTSLRSQCDALAEILRAAGIEARSELVNPDTNLAKNHGVIHVMVGTKL